MQANGDSRKSAHLNDSFGILLRLGTHPEYLFVTCPLPLFQQLAADPPHQGIEPEHRFDAHVDRRRKIVPAPRMAQFVRDDGIQLSGSQSLGDSRR